MNFAEYLDCDATALAGHVANGDTTAGELLELALAQQRRVHGSVNAVHRLMEEQARAQLSGPLAGPFAGVPFLLKDCGQDYAGVPTGFGSRSMLHQAPAEHSAVVRRFLDAGLVVFGKTNLPEFALKAVSDSEANGRANNPWDPGHTPGGSSGGSAAAVAAGIVPMAAGNDGGGSIRIPAACCGLFGLRPSRGRVSSAPSPEVWFGASNDGVISRSVRDTARALDVLQGPEPGDPFVIAAPEAPYFDLMRREPGRLRIGFTDRSPIGTEVHPDAVAAVRHAADLLRRLGHEVDEAEPDIDGAALARSFLHVYFGQVPVFVARAMAQGAASSEIETMTRVLVTLGDSISAPALTAQLGEWNTYARALARFHQRYDMLLTPTLAHPPVRHGMGEPPAAQKALLGFLQRTGLLAILARLGLLEGAVNQIATDSLRYVPFTQLANLTGTPAMSVPLYWSSAGLPLGVQFVAPFGREDRLLQLAHQLEEAQPWFGRLPAWVRTGQD